LPNETPAARSIQAISVPKLLPQSGGIKLLFVISANVYDNKPVGEELKAYTEVALKP